jgi:hypothetical protein
MRSGNMERMPKMPEMKFPLKSAKYELWLTVQLQSKYNPQVKLDYLVCYDIHKLLKGGNSKISIFYFDSNQYWGSNGAATGYIQRLDPNGNTTFERR